jgi:leucyl/phenylalanyl-tRNA---protein transferase
MVIRAYSIGIFPMASRRDDSLVHWVAPQMRGILPLDRFHIPRRLRRTLRGNRFQVVCDRSFGQVIHSCAEPREGHPETWINAEIIRVFNELHRLGHAHSIEVHRDGRLVGGLYGLALGGAFFGESMFSIEPDASKVALVHLVARLRIGAFALLDIQFVTEHLRQFGAVEVPASHYLQHLDAAMRLPARFYSNASEGALGSVLESLFSQSSTQTS